MMRAILLAVLSTSLCILTPAFAQTPTATSYAPQYTLPININTGENVIPNIHDPKAVDAQAVCPGYTASAVKRTPLGFLATLKLAGPACNVYGTDVETLALKIEYQSSTRLNINIQPTHLDTSNTSFYSLPDYLVPHPHCDPDAAQTIVSNDLGFFWSNVPSFGFTVIRLSTGDVLFSSMGTKLVYEDQFIEFVTSMPDNYNLYGLPEAIHGLRLGNNYTRTFWAADDGNPVDYNIYGTHPFYLDTRYYEVNSTTGNLTLVTTNTTDASASYVSYSHILYNRNAHGQDVLLRPNNITWRAIGGQIDLYFFSGPSAVEATAQYQQAASGLPAMQQYFTFGFHQCRWGYANWTVLQGVVDGYARFGIPLENIWTDIDYMSFYRDFENDPVRFGYSEGQQFLARLAANGQHYVPIVDAAVYVPNPANASDAYPTFNKGNATGSYMLNPDGSLYIGDVWPGFTVFPDWLTDSGAGQWWIEQMLTWHSQINGTFWSGIWIDMSEVSSFCIGSCGSKNLSSNPAHPPFLLPGQLYAKTLDYPEGFNLTNGSEAASASSASVSQSMASASFFGTQAAPTTTFRTTPTPGVRNVNHPPYVINNVLGDLAVHAVAPNATHHDGTQEYDVHNLFGLGIMNATYQALLRVFPGKRPFIIGRSQFVSAGTFAGHWGGDNYATFASMSFSIPQALQFSLAGIPMFGVDTCGFAGNTDEELCNRWMQLSAFFPFYRNHNTLDGAPQEAYVWASVIDATKTAMAIRFQLLPYMYTLFYQAATTGTTVLRALAWEVPQDPALAAADRQFFLGPAILVTPVLVQGVKSVAGVFPGVGRGEKYYDWYTQACVTDGLAPGANVTIQAPLGHIPVFVRGGHVLAMQQPAMTTAAARNTSWSVLVALGMTGSASGSLYLDDGESLEPNATLYVNIAATQSMLLASGRGNYTDANPLANVTVLGLPSAPVGNVTLNGASVSGKVVYNASSQVLFIGGLEGVTAAGAWSGDWVLRW